jgi:hypothetical protein
MPIGKLRRKRSEVNTSPFSGQVLLNVSDMWSMQDSTAPLRVNKVVRFCSFQFSVLALELKWASLLVNAL